MNFLKSQKVIKPYLFHIQMNSLLRNKVKIRILKLNKEMFPIKKHGTQLNEYIIL